jgi:hypothetical protein
MTKTFNLLELQDMQKTGEWPLAHSQLLADKYKDRYQVIDSLFKKLSPELFFKISSFDGEDEPVIEDWADPNIPDKSYALKHQGPLIGYDIDTMTGPIDWYNEEAGQGDRVERRKLYIYDWTGEKLSEDFPELEYFVEMHADFKPVLEHYAKLCYKDQEPDWEKVLYKLMIIQYNVPVADDSNRVEHRKHNTERFGAEHCDETLGGLHLGENFVEFHAKNTASGEWQTFDNLTDNGTLWMFGEYAERSGWIPTYHGMTHNPDPSHDVRYSIIFDLQARYKGEE